MGCLVLGGVEGGFMDVDLYLCLWRVVAISAVVTTDDVAVLR